MEEKKETFEYNYSAKQQKEIKTIREKYVPKEENKMEQLLMMDYIKMEKDMLIKVKILITI